MREATGPRVFADTLAEHADDIRQVVGGINGFRAYYLPPDIAPPQLTAGDAVIDFQGAELAGGEAFLGRALPK